MKAVNVPGIVKWYNQQLGYGFISVAPSLKRTLGLPGDADLYVHASGIEGRPPKQLQAEDRVEFGVVEGNKGLRAVHVRVTVPATVPTLQHVAD